MVRELRRLKSEADVKCEENRGCGPFVEAHRQIGQLMSAAQGAACPVAYAKQETDMVSAAFEIAGREMHHKTDLNLLLARIDELFDWHDNDALKAKYMAPYLSIIQSYGMGKTKLVYECKQHLRSQGNGCELIMCEDWKEAFRDVVFDDTRSLTVLDKKGCPDWEKTKQFVIDTLDQILAKKRRRKKLLIVFDEAQTLFSGHGWKMRCIRAWLCLKHPYDVKVAAIFCGRTTLLAEGWKGSSSLSPHEEGESYSQGGRDLFPPFHPLSAIGSCVKNGANMDGTEYERAIPYGRPLFAVMHDMSVLRKEQLERIVSRLLLSSSPESRRKACLSVLGTRVQMGQTLCYEVASDLVRRGYANLTYFNSETSTARICFSPDPVCARLAMGMMDEEWSHEGHSGRPPLFWTKKAGEIFSGNLCYPRKGNVGSIGAALYMLLCGDVLRKRLDKNYHTFSVSMKDWVKLMKRGKAEVEGSTDDRTVSVAFIQVCESLVRRTLCQLCDPTYLEHLYKSGTCRYTHSSKSFDMFGALKVHGTPSAPSRVAEYFPFFVAVKRWESDGKVKEALEDMTKEVRDAPRPCFCLLVLFGSVDESKCDAELYVEPGHVDEFVEKKKNLAKALVLPKSDEFGVSSFVCGTIS